MDLFQGELELNEVEKRLKQAFLAAPARHLEEACEMEDVRDVLGYAFTGSNEKNFGAEISEQLFIEDGLDCSFVRHMRYMPAYRHKHEFFELLYVLRGSCANIYDTHTLTMRAGDLCISAPSSVHAVSAFSDGAILLNILLRKSTFDTAFLGLMDEDDILSSFFRRAFYRTDEIPYLLVRTGDDRRLVEILREAYREHVERHRFRGRLLNVYMMEFFIQLFRRHEQDILVPSVRVSASQENLVYILRYIQEHYTTVTLKELAVFFNYSERQLQRIIEKATGETFLTLLQKKRMAEAARLLKDTALSIEAVGELVGYPSPNNFRRIFEKHYGCTPRAYRKGLQP